MLVELGEPARYRSGWRRPAAAARRGHRLSLPATDSLMGTPAFHQLPAPANEGRDEPWILVVCTDCWTDWLKDYSIKVINELRLDLSTDRGQKVLQLLTVKVHRKPEGADELRMPRCNNRTWTIEYLLWTIGRLRPLPVGQAATARSDRELMLRIRGLEVGLVLAGGDAAIMRILPNTSVGQLLRCRRGRRRRSRQPAVAGWQGTFRASGAVGPRTRTAAGSPRRGSAGRNAGWRCSPVARES